ncbi:hypothetical protein Hsar01_04128 [Haloferula sargassicola]|uniref:Uncharacterized protein n=1 Tax=Haloferula sargassicola TaxID=490096 RepID=A0ABP9UXT5_9BACT
MEKERPKKSSVTPSAGRLTEVMVGGVVSVSEVLMKYSASIPRPVPVRRR